MSFLELAKENFDIVAVIVASFLALVLHAADLLPETYILPLILFLLALHVLHEMRSEIKHDQEVAVIHSNISSIDMKIKAGEISLIKPSELLEHTREMALKNKGEIWWFNICINMFLSDVVFENVFKPAIENKDTTRIIPVLKDEYRKTWERDVTPKIKSCSGAENVSSPVWVESIDENIAFIAIDSGEKPQKEADIAVWGEPFMAEYMTHEGGLKKSVPRYLIHVKSDSELIYRLKDIFDKYRHKGR
ncbi:hypothetical protein BMS3Abin16_00377 [archaeon BMS3Abin16]|nr:hypothetical protein BMS3Abin16_00377 [archaeon BMS3Abin16]HDY74351.1 hypothetical protein [Euryarchaeota archaeon]